MNRIYDAQLSWKTICILVFLAKKKEFVGWLTGACWNKPYDCSHQSSCTNFYMTVAFSGLACLYCFWCNYDNFLSHKYQFFHFWANNEGSKLVDVHVLKMRRIWYWVCLEILFAQCPVFKKWFIMHWDYRASHHFCNLFVISGLLFYLFYLFLCCKVISTTIGPIQCVTQSVATRAATQTLSPLPPSKNNRCQILWELYQPCCVKKEDFIEFKKIMSTNISIFSYEYCNFSVKGTGYKSGQCLPKLVLEHAKNNQF